MKKTEFTIQKVCYGHRLTNNRHKFSQSGALNPYTTATNNIG